MFYKKTMICENRDENVSKIRKFIFENSSETSTFLAIKLLFTKYWEDCVKLKKGKILNWYSMYHNIMKGKKKYAVT